MQKQSDKEAIIKKAKEKYYELKNKSGSHSPSALLIQKEIPEVNLTIDCCFLSNPYATEAFMKRLKSAISNEKWLYSQIESYPAQNAQIAEDVAKSTGVKAENIFIGNGATEAISAILNNFIQGKILIMLPTFSPYYEYVNKKTTTIHYYPLIKGEDRYYFDIENFKMLNQKYGFWEGNTFLKSFAGLLNKTFEGAITAHFSNDNFVVLAKDENIKDKVLGICKKLSEYQYDIKLKKKVGAYKPENKEILPLVACDHARYA